MLSASEVLTFNVGLLEGLEGFDQIPWTNDSDVGFRGIRAGTGAFGFGTAGTDGLKFLEFQFEPFRYSCGRDPQLAFRRLMRSRQPVHLE